MDIHCHKVNRNHAGLTKDLQRTVCWPAGSDGLDTCRFLPNEGQATTKIDLGEVQPQAPSATVHYRSIKSAQVSPDLMSLQLPT